MANCFLCGNKIGMFDVGAYINNLPICSSCDALIRQNVNDVFAMCHTNEELNQYQKLIVENFQTQFSDDKLEVLKKHITHIKNIYSTNLKKNNNPNTSSDPVSNLNAIHQKKIDSHMLTTGYSFHGYKITKYINIVQSEIVLGTGFLSEISATVTDTLGISSATMANKLSEAKYEVQYKLIRKSIKSGANATIGIDFDITTLRNNILVVSATGTAVVVEQEI